MLLDFKSSTYTFIKAGLAKIQMPFAFDQTTNTITSSIKVIVSDNINYLTVPITFYPTDQHQVMYMHVGLDPLTKITFSDISVMPIVAPAVAFELDIPNIIHLLKSAGTAYAYVNGDLVFQLHMSYHFTNTLTSVSNSIYNAIRTQLGLPGTASSFGGVVIY